MITRVYRGFRKPLLWWLYRKVYAIDECMPFYSFMFTDSCKYDNGDEQGDWNKLYGISNSLNPHLFSYRIAWRYLKEEDVFELAPYYYDKGICYIYYNRHKVVANVKFITYIEFDNVKREVIFNVDDKELLKLLNVPRPLCFKELGLYIGGTCKAKHTMKFKRRRIL